MRKIKKLEEKLEIISKDVGIKYWVEKEVDDNGSPPAYFNKKKILAQYDNMPINKAFELLLDHLGLEIKIEEYIVDAKIVKRKK